MVKWWIKVDQWARHTWIISFRSLTYWRSVSTISRTTLSIWLKLFSKYLGTDVWLPLWHCGVCEHRQDWHDWQYWDEWDDWSSPLSDLWCASVLITVKLASDDCECDSDEWSDCCEWLGLPLWKLLAERAPQPFTLALIILIMPRESSASSKLSMLASLGEESSNWSVTMWHVTRHCHYWHCRYWHCWHCQTGLIAQRHSLWTVSPSLWWSLHDSDLAWSPQTPQTPLD